MSYTRIDLFGNGAVLIEDMREMKQVNILLHKAFQERIAFARDFYDKRFLALAQPLSLKPIPQEYSCHSFKYQDRDIMNKYMWLKYNTNFN